MDVELPQINTQALSCTITPEDLERGATETYPIVRVMLQVKMAIRAEWPDDNGGEPRQLVRDWLPVGHPDRAINLEIANRDFEGGFPRIVDADGAGEPADRAAVDRILYTDNGGREFSGLPPMTFTWRGELGPLRGDWSDVYDHDYPNTYSLIERACCGLSRGLQGVTVVHQHSHPDLDDTSLGDANDPRRSKLYEGQLTFSANAIGCDA